MGHHMQFIVCDIFVFLNMLHYYFQIRLCFYSGKECFGHNTVYNDCLDMIKLQRSKGTLKMFRISIVNLFAPSESLLHIQNTKSFG